MISFCPSDRSHPVWEMVINELDRRDDPLSDEPLPGCQLVSSCSNIFDPDQFARMLRHNFERHLNSNRAPLGLHFNAVWLKNNKGFKQYIAFYYLSLFKLLYRGTRYTNHLSERALGIK